MHMSTLFTKRISKLIMSKLIQCSSLYFFTLLYSHVPDFALCSTGFIKLASPVLASLIVKILDMGPGLAIWQQTVT